MLVFGYASGYLCPMGGRHLHNRLGRKELEAKLESEGLERKTVSFYKYVTIQNPETLRNELFKEWESLGVRGRIYVAKEGINAQLSIASEKLDALRQSVDEKPAFKDVPFKIAVEETDTSFLKLAVKVKKKLVADGLPDDTFDTANVGKHLDAKAWNEAIAQGAKVIDMRNNYECEIGYFDGAYLPKAQKFEEALPEVLNELKGKEKEPVLLYCTGGIRCEKASAWLRHHGFDNVSQLHGGIIDYAHQVKQYGLKNNYKGLNFVFDGRLTERIGEEVVSRCHQCDAPADRIINCESKTCNILLVQCDNCAKRFDNCCTPRCKEARNLPEDLAKEFRKGAGSRSSKEKMITDTRALQALIAEQELTLSKQGTLLPELKSRIN